MEAFLFIMSFIFGTTIGSFINVVVDRSELHESPLGGRSHCDHCKRTLEWYELIPVLSYIFLSGRCNKCGKKLSIQYPVVEILTGLTFLSVAMNNQPVGEDSVLALITIVLSLVVASLFIIIFLTDLKFQIIPDWAVVMSSVCIVVYLLLNSPDSIISGLISALSGSVFFMLIWIATRGNGMGMGDVKLAFPIGLLTGFPLVIFSFYVAFLTGALAGVILILRGQKKLKSRIAFGPFLILGTIVSILFRNQILQFAKGFIL